MREAYEPVSINGQRYLKFCTFWYDIERWSEMENLFWIVTHPYSHDQLERMMQSELHFFIALLLTVLNACFVFLLFSSFQKNRTGKVRKERNLTDQLEFILDVETMNHPSRQTVRWRRYRYAQPWRRHGGQGNRFSWVLGESVALLVEMKIYQDHMWVRTIVIEIESRAT